MQKIVSLVPSLTELLYDLGLEDEVVGITKFCVHPQKWFRTKQRVGGTKNVKIEIVRQLNPTLIIANKEENNKDQIEELAKEFPVLVTEIKTLEDAYKAIESIGREAGKNTEAKNIINRIRAGFEALKGKFEPVPVAYMIWNDPPMTIGGDTFINDVLHYAGFMNVFSDRSRYPEASFETLLQSEAKYILLSSEPFPFKQKHLDSWQAKLPGKKVLLIDGEMCSWYGSRLIMTADYLTHFRQGLKNG